MPLNRPLRPNEFDFLLGAASLLCANDESGPWQTAPCHGTVIVYGTGSPTGGAGRRIGAVGCFKPLT